MRNYLIIILACALLFSACELEPENCDDVESDLLTDKNDCWAAKAAKEGNAGICNAEIEGDNTQCFGRVAVSLADVSICAGADDVEWCKRIYLQQAESKDMASCMKGDNKDECLAHLAASLDDENKCFAANNPNYCLGLMSYEAGKDYCDYATDKNECISVMEGVPEAAGECKWDYQCPGTCEGKILQKWACNGRSNTCERTFTDDCSKLFEDVGGYDIPKTCVKDECRIDREAMIGKKTEISNEVKQLLKARQDLTEMQLFASRECLKGLEDITSEAIIETAQIIGSLYGGLKSLLGEIVSSSFISKLTTDTDMTPAEYIALNCNVQKSITEDLDMLGERIQKLQEGTRKIDDRLILDGLAG